MPFTGGLGTEHKSQAKQERHSYSLQFRQCQSLRIHKVRTAIANRQFLHQVSGCSRVPALPFPPGVLMVLLMKVGLQPAVL